MTIQPIVILLQIHIYLLAADTDKSDLWKIQPLPIQKSIMPYSLLRASLIVGLHRIVNL